MSGDVLAAWGNLPQTPNSITQSAINIREFILNNLPCDFLAIQEATQSYRIITKLPPEYKFWLTTSGPTKICTVYHKKYSVKDTIKGEFENGRPFQIILFQQNICFINLHYSHKHQMDEIVNIIETKLSAHQSFVTKSRIIIAGDFNYEVDKLKIFGIEILNVDNYMAKKTCCNDSLTDGNVYPNRYDNILDNEKPIEIIVGSPQNPASDHLPIVGFLKPLAPSLPIMDLFGQLPIANQELQNGIYMKTLANSSIETEFIKISETTDPNFIQYKQRIQNDIVVLQPNFSEITAPSNVSTVIAKIQSKLNSNPHKTNFGVINSGNACYFIVCLQLLFSMTSIREILINTRNQFPNKFLLDFSFVINCLEGMKTSSNPFVYTESSYLKMKQNFFNDLHKKEEDADEFLRTFFTKIQPIFDTIKDANPNNDLFKEIEFDYQEYIDYAANYAIPAKFDGNGTRRIKTNPVINSFSVNPINLNSPYVKTNKNGIPATNLVQLLNNFYQNVRLMDGSNARIMSISAMNINEKIYCYEYSKMPISKTPTYLYIPFSLGDNQTKIKHTYLINKIIQIFNPLAEYVLTAMVLHTGNHYVSYVLINYDSANNKSTYRLYNDSSYSDHIEDNNSPYLNQLNYKGKSNTPYFFIYTKVN